ncbi:MAG: orotate phosphoribosyltransferase [Ignavibacteria bacterium]|nr:orotate phosphoribosyltransferase [Ignavibacteria bacterium]
MTQEEVIKIFIETGGLLEGHFILTSGYHSPHYFQCAKVLEYPQYNTLFANEIANHFRNFDINLVISPAIGGIVLGTEVGRILNVRTIFAERENDKMTLRRGFNISEKDNILIVEDVVTTGKSVFEVIDIINEYKGNLKGVGYIIDRSNGKVKFNTEQFCLAKLDVVKYAPDEIPEWLNKIPPIKPGSRKI